MSETDYVIKHNIENMSDRRGIIFHRYFLLCVIRDASGQSIFSWCSEKRALKRTIYCSLNRYRVWERGAYIIDWSMGLPE